jgi:DNA invertase Pin-like site-specific DNA recombinase
MARNTNDRMARRQFLRTAGLGALAQFERNLIQERTKAGLEAARARGRKGGRPKSLTAQQRALALDLYAQRKHIVEEICRTLGISKPTLYAYVRGESSKP